MKCESQTLLLEVADKSWPVKLNVNLHKGTALLSSGWRAFARENSLEVGDVCIFELIERNMLNIVTPRYLPVSCGSPSAKSTYAAIVDLAANSRHARILKHDVEMLQLKALQGYSFIAPRSRTSQAGFLSNSEKPSISLTATLFPILQKDLRIPGEFLRKCREGLSSPVVLKVPGGAIWHVELLVCGHEVWLGNGWRELAGYYFLAFGHLILFKHQGDSIFHVFIFDKSATEIKYPCGSICAGKPKLQDPKTEENDDDLPSGKKRGRNHHFYCLSSGRELIQQ
ncbi:hypothetical protein GH714_010208 [Hevea brasiliensis]|uniref:TF-B3 domain-containing protein n=1 Tax=Hevea brasiliensis TaxID=3981 RepID=A0A6A6N017_HEVBR|nr:hypothetical protein GH714_010208 [Hevea brasiliensis]